MIDHDHDCEQFLEWQEASAPCPACPDGIWTAHDAICGLCGACLQAAGHAHGPWLARTDEAALQEG